MKIAALVLTLILTVTAFAQRPQPVVEAGGVLNGAGQTAVGAAGLAGVIWDTKHFFTLDEAGYETGGKNNDNDNTSSSGHTRVLTSQVLAKTGKYFYGVGVEWNKLYTPDYSRSAVHPKATVGRDFSGGYVSRVLVSYIDRGTDTTNGLQGVEGRAFWFLGQHAFLSLDIGGYWGHGTVIPVSEGGSPASVASELSSHVVTGKTLGVLGWRF